MQQRQEQIQVFIFKGRVQFVNGKPVVKALVRAYDRDLRNEQFLNEKRTDGNGYYEISYTAAQFIHDDKGVADLHVNNNDGRVLASSSVYFNAGPVATIDLVIGGATVLGSSEYELLLADS